MIQIIKLLHYVVIIFLIFISPSKVPVSIKHILSDKLLYINIKSEGNTPSFITHTISPIHKLPLFILIPSPFLYISTSIEFCSLSNFFLYKSSNASLINDTPNTNIKYDIIVVGLYGLNIGIHYIIVINKKYILDKRIIDIIMLY